MMRLGSSPELWLLACAFVAAAVGSLLMRGYALRNRMLDLPNERSSHVVPTPRGGGLAIVVTFLVGLVFLYSINRVPLDLFIALIGGGVLVAAISFWEDHHRLSIRLRITVHFAAAGWALYWLGGMAPLDVGFATWSWGWPRQMLGMIGLVWLINLYNFMDGIDGLAAAEAIFVALGAAYLLGATGDIGWTLMLLASCCAGFIVLNWSPAQIFMGDSGSCFLGFVFGVVAIASAAREALPIWAWVILLGVFLVDSTFTLLRRMVRRVRWYDSHCSHGYQRATQRLSSHLAVVTAIVIINALWLLPVAYLSVAYRDLAFMLVWVAFAPLLGLVWWLGAGSAHGDPRR